MNGAFEGLSSCERDQALPISIYVRLSAGRACKLHCVNDARQPQRHTHSYQLPDIQVLRDENKLVVALTGDFLPGFQSGVDQSQAEPLTRSCARRVLGS